MKCGMSSSCRAQSGQSGHTPSLRRFKICPSGGDDEPWRRVEKVHGPRAVNICFSSLVYTMAREIMTVDASLGLAASSAAQFIAGSDIMEI